MRLASWSTAWQSFHCAVNWCALPNPAPVLIAAGADAVQDDIDRLTSAGCEVVVCRSTQPRMAAHSHEPVAIAALLDELGRRRMTNVLVEGGGELLGSFFDAGAIDEVHIFIAPKIIGGRGAPAPIGGGGVEAMTAAQQLADVEVRRVGDDQYVRGRIIQPL